MHLPSKQHQAGTVYFPLIAYVYPEINRMQLFVDKCFSIGNRGVLKGNYSARFPGISPGIRLVTDPGSNEERTGNSWRRPVYRVLFLTGFCNSVPVLR